MQVSLLFDMVLGFGISFFTSQNDTRTVATLRKLQAAKVAGANIDDHMQRVADSLLAGEPLDWDSLDAAIDAETKEFLDR